MMNKDEAMASLGVNWLALGMIQSLNVI